MKNEPDHTPLVRTIGAEGHLRIVGCICGWRCSSGAFEQDPDDAYAAHCALVGVACLPPIKQASAKPVTRRPVVRVVGNRIEVIIKLGVRLELTAGETREAIRELEMALGRLTAGEHVYVYRPSDGLCSICGFAESNRAHEVGP